MRSFRLEHWIGRGDVAPDSLGEAGEGFVANPPVEGDELERAEALAQAAGILAHAMGPHPVSVHAHCNLVGELEVRIQRSGTASLPGLPESPSDPESGGAG